jgi:hypothetical protein
MAVTRGPRKVAEPSKRLYKLIFHFLQTGNAPLTDKEIRDVLQESTVPSYTLDKLKRLGIIRVAGSKPNVGTKNQKHAILYNLTFPEAIENAIRPLRK